MTGSESSSGCCPHCGAELSPSTLGGVCTRCALTAALDCATPDEGAGVLSLHDIPLPGEKVAYIGNYELIEVIGRGGMGVVYKARQANPTRFVALKLLLGGVHASEEFKRRFERETQALA